MSAFVGHIVNPRVAEPRVVRRSLKHISELEGSIVLAELGFREVGECTLDEGLKSGVRFRIVELHNERVIYAYTVVGEVKYIGVCDSDTTTLKERMGRYQGMIGGGTNKRITLAIKECLLKGQAVKVLALKPDTEMEFKGLEVDLVKGLENPLLNKVRPVWNIKR